MQEAVEAITSILGMAASEGSDAVPPNARSHTLLLAGKLIGDAQVRVIHFTQSFEGFCYRENAHLEYCRNCSLH